MTFWHVTARHRNESPHFRAFSPWLSRSRLQNDTNRINEGASLHNQCSNHHSFGRNVIERAWRGGILDAKITELRSRRLNIKRVDGVSVVPRHPNNIFLWSERKSGLLRAPTGSSAELLGRHTAITGIDVAEWDIKGHAYGIDGAP